MNPTTNSDGEWRISIERWRAGDPDERGPMYCVYLVRSNGEWPRNARRVGDLWDEEAVELTESGGQKQAGVDDGDLVFEQPAPTIGKGRVSAKLHCQRLCWTNRRLNALAAQTPAVRALILSARSSIQHRRPPP